MHRNGLISLLVALLVVVVAALWWLDFHITQSESHAESGITTMRSGQAGPPQVIDLKASTVKNLKTYVADAHQADSSLSQALIRELRANGSDAQSTSESQPPQQSGEPVLLVQLEQSDHVWLAGYGHSKLNVTLSYDSNGDLSWKGTKPVEMPNYLPTTRIQGAITIDDVTWGVLSRPGYDHLLAEQIVKQISKAIPASAIQSN